LSPIWVFIITLTEEKPAEIRDENGVFIIAVV
jgi:hypothetical protein